jgi:predicted nucleic acid-binding protein
MILVDTSVWIDHLRHGDPTLSELLHARQIIAHPFVIGELALGSLRQREAVLGALRDLPQSLIASDSEAQTFIERHKLYGLGIGYVDVHLLAATFLNRDARLWTRDKRLRQTAARLAVDASIDH